jgi:hypothetical protein
LQRLPHVQRFSGPVPWTDLPGLTGGAPQDEGPKVASVLARLCTAARAAVGLLAVRSGEDGRFLFRAGQGLQCPDSAVYQVCWSYGKRLSAQPERLAQRFCLRSDAFRDHPEFRFEVMLGFRNLCYQPLRIDGRVLGAALLGNPARGEFTTADLRRLTAAAPAAGAEIERLRLYQELREVFIHSVHAFVSAIDAKDPYTHGHSERVTAFAIKIAQELGWTESQIEVLKMSAILHDVGKIGVPEAILSKPGRLTAEEFGVIRRHPEIGTRIIGEIPQMSRTLPGILHHHESYDGKGYPEGLAADRIPKLGRLIAVADAYDAMTSDRPYRTSLRREDAVQEVRAQCGRQFDPEMVAAFLRAYERGAIY